MYDRKGWSLLRIPEGRAPRDMLGHGAYRVLIQVGPYRYVAEHLMDWALRVAMGQRVSFPLSKFARPRHNPTCLGVE